MDLPSEGEMRGDTILCVQSFFRKYLKVNILRYSDTFLSEPQREGHLEHYFCYCFTARMSLESKLRYRRIACNSLIDSEKFIRTKINVYTYKLLFSSRRIFVFVLIIFRKQSVDSAHQKVSLRYG